MPYALPSPSTSPTTIPLSLSRNSSSSSIASQGSSNGRLPTRRNHSRQQSFDAGSSTIGLGYFTPNPNSQSQSLSSSSSSLMSSATVPISLTSSVQAHFDQAVAGIYLQPATPPVTGDEKTSVGWNVNGESSKSSHDDRRSRRGHERDGSGSDGGSASSAEATLQMRRPPATKWHTDFTRARVSSEADASRAPLQIDINDVKSGNRPPLRSALRNSHVGRTPSVGDGDEGSPVSMSSLMVRKKSGELVKPSLKGETRSAPSTPICPKYVHFDTQLEHVKLFLAQQRPTAVSRDGSPVETETEDDSEGFPFPSMLSEVPNSIVLHLPNFPAPGTRSIETPVFLDQIEIGEDRKALKGVVQVANIAFHKSVAIRFTFDDWQTVSEVSGEYVTSVAAGKADRFAFTIKLQDLLARLEEKILFLAVRYHANGQEMWDNNGGGNYRLEFKRAGKLAKLAPHEKQAHDLRQELVKLAEDEIGMPRLKVKGAAFAEATGEDGVRAVQPATSTPLSTRYDFGASFKSSGPPPSQKPLFFHPVGDAAPFTRPAPSPTMAGLGLGSPGPGITFINGMPATAAPVDEDTTPTLPSQATASPSTSNERPVFHRRKSPSASGTWLPDFRPSSMYEYQPSQNGGPSSASSSESRPFPRMVEQVDPGSRSHSPYYGDTSIFGDRVVRNMPSGGTPLFGDRVVREASSSDGEVDENGHSQGRSQSARFNSFPPISGGTGLASLYPGHAYNDYSKYLDLEQHQSSSPPHEPASDDAASVEGEEASVTTATDSESEDTETDTPRAKRVPGDRAGSPPPPLTVRPNHSPASTDEDMRSPELTDTNTTNSSLGSPRSPSASPPSPAAFQLVPSGQRPPMTSPNYTDFVDKYCFFQSPQSSALGLTNGLGAIGGIIGVLHDPAKPRSASRVPPATPVSVIGSSPALSPYHSHTPSPAHSPVTSIPPSVTSSPPVSRSPSSTGSSTPSQDTRSPVLDFEQDRSKYAHHAHDGQVVAVKTAVHNFARSTSPFNNGLDGLGLAGSMGGRPITS